jgi:S-formylglutathione hydrolase FrmB
MSLATLNFESVYLNGSTEISVILPDKPRGVDSGTFYKEQAKYKVLWLLHGSFGDNTDWVRKTLIEQYACEKEMAVVMPSALNSSYVNWNGFMKGYAMRDYFFRELLPMVYAWFPVSEKREDSFIAGLSMGGNGALLYALDHPEKFAAAAVFSTAPVDLGHKRAGKENEWNATVKNRVANVGGFEQYFASEDNTWKRLFEMKDPAALPRMYYACGTQDNCYREFLDFQAEAEKRNLPIQFESFEGYAHEWRFWDLVIQKALMFFNPDKEETKGNAF